MRTEYKTWKQLTMLRVLTHKAKLAREQEDPRELEQVTRELQALRREIEAQTY